MDFKGVKDYFSWLYYQYQIISCCAVLEPWEQSMFNTILLTIFAMVVYTAYVFIPIHIRLAWEFFSKICGYQEDSQLSMNLDAFPVHNDSTPLNTWTPAKNSWNLITKILP
uniref:Serine palmitoyltransferase small subunit B n=1 Tax=Sus scrofa TaxID=9823 RepID=A0A4X1VFE1_PIG